MERKTQTGYLVLADISGYTSFVAQTEIEHAGLALSYLLETIVEKLSLCLTISKLEGDAIFACCEESSVPNGKTLLGLIDQVYLAFRDKGTIEWITVTLLQPLPILFIGIFTMYQAVVNTVRALSDKPIRYPLSIPFIR